MNTSILDLRTLVNILLPWSMHLLHLKRVSSLINISFEKLEILYELQMEIGPLLGTTYMYPDLFKWFIILYTAYS